jgi:DNA-binding GntR family transcriptional regulator
MSATVRAITPSGIGSGSPIVFKLRRDDIMDGGPGRMLPMVSPDADAGDRAPAEGQARPVGYMRIAEGLRREIAEGILARGKPLPSEADLGAVLGVARTTVRRALKLLEAEGLIESRQGSGWRVCGAEDSPGPAYTGLLDDLRRRIRGGHLAIGERLPSENALAVTYKCARGTVRRALVELELEGLIETRPGVGRFVVRSPGAKTSRAKKSGSD